MAVGVEVLLAEFLELAEQQAQLPGEEDEGAAEELNPDLAEQFRSLAIEVLNQAFKTGATWSLRVVIQGLDEMGIPYTKASPGGSSYGLHHTGCQVRVGDGNISIQTHPHSAWEAFAETMLRNCSALQQEDYHALGYYPENPMKAVLRWDTPEELFAHVREVLRYYAAKAGQGAGSEGGTSTPQGEVKEEQLLHHLRLLHHLQHTHHLQHRPPEHPQQCSSV